MVVTLASIFIRFLIFESGTERYNSAPLSAARVAKLVDARDLKSLGSDPLPVRVRPRAPFTNKVGILPNLHSTLNSVVKVISRKVSAETP